MVPFLLQPDLLVAIRQFAHTIEPDGQIIRPEAVNAPGRSLQSVWRSMRDSEENLFPIDPSQIARPVRNQGLKAHCCFRLSCDKIIAILLVSSQQRFRGSTDRLECKGPSVLQGEGTACTLKVKAKCDRQVQGLGTNFQTVFSEH